MARGATILIVEDDEGLRRMYRNALALAGYEIREARSGYEALASLDRNPPDLVVLDLGLPGIGGVDVRHELASGVQSRHIPIVVVTGAATVPDNIDVACVLRKPVSEEELIRTVRNCLAASAG